MRSFDWGYLKVLRRQNKLKQQEAAYLFNVVTGRNITTATLSNWENGRTEIPASSLAALSSIYGEHDMQMFFYEGIGD